MEEKSDKKTDKCTNVNTTLTIDSGHEEK